MDHPKLKTPDMKMKKLLLATLLATAGAAFVNSASATAVDVYISGATTYRACVTAAICDSTNGILGGDAVTYPITGAYTGSSLYKAQAAIFHGYLKGSGEGRQEVYIHTYWTGAAAGVYDIGVSNPVPGYMEDPASLGGTIPGTASLTLLPITGSNPSIGGQGSVPSPGSANGYTPTSVVPDASLSDSLPSTVANEFTTYDPSISATINGAGLTSCGNSTRNPSSQAAGVGTVGIAPILWVLGNSNIAANFTNISTQAIRSLMGAGVTRAELLSGNSADNTNWVCLIGRNEDSGTRIAAMSDSLYLVTNPPTQFLPTFGGTVVNQSPSPTYPDSGNPGVAEGGPLATVTSLGEWPTDWCLNTEVNIDWFTPGHSGFNGGGDVANCLAALNPVTGLNFVASSVQGDVLNNGDDNSTGKPVGYVNTESVWLVGYLGVADAIGGGSLGGPNGQTLSAGASVSNGVVLSYNGVKYTGLSSVENGSYTNWVLEHMYTNPNNGTDGNQAGPVRQTVDDIADALFTTFAPTNSSGITDHTGATVNVAGILYGDMNYTRASETAPPAHK